MPFCFYIIVIASSTLNNENRAIFFLPEQSSIIYFGSLPKHCPIRTYLLTSLINMQVTREIQLHPHLPVDSQHFRVAIMV